MRATLLEAKKAADSREVPAGVVLVQNRKILARGCNLQVELNQFFSCIAHLNLIKNLEDAACIGPHIPHVCTNVLLGLSAEINSRKNFSCYFLLKQHSNMDSYMQDQDAPEADTNQTIKSKETSTNIGTTSSQPSLEDLITEWTS